MASATGRVTHKPAAGRPSGRKPKQNLDMLLDELAEAAADRDGDGRVTFGDLMNAVGRRSYGPLILLIGLIAISPVTLIPGMTWLCAALTFLIAGQLALGMKRPWLPRGILSRDVGAEKLKEGVEKARPWAQRIDKVIRPRFTFLAAPPFVNLVALACVAAALVTIPLGFIPLAPMAPSAAIILFGLGMTARDGLLLSLGLALFAAAAFFLAPLALDIF